MVKWWQGLPIGHHSRTILTGATVSIWGLLALRGTRMLLLLLKTRTMTPHDVGTLTLGISFAVFIFVLSSGFPVAILRFGSMLHSGEAADADNRSLEQRTKGIAMRVFLRHVPFSLAILIAGNVAARPLAVGVFASESLVGILRLTLIGVFFSNLTLLSTSLLQSRYKVRYLYAALVGEVLLNLLFVSAALGFPNRLMVFAWGFLFGSVAIFCLSALALRREMPFLFDPAIRPVYGNERIFRFALLSSLASTVTKVRAFVVIYLVGFFLTPTSLALYNVAFRVGTLPNLLPLGINAILAPVAARLFGSGEITSLRRLHLRLAVGSLCLSIIAFAGYLLLGGAVLSMFGAHYVQALRPLLVIAASTIPANTFGSSAVIINMMGRPQVNTMNETLLLLLVGVLTAYLVPKYGVLGAGWAFAISQSLTSGLSFIIVLILYARDARRTENANHVQ